ncbi:recombinase family protein [Candidatus Pacearchaeota archaeon]|nr:recombinase family protein [Candidatus Pacearchaeota archaeon]
MTPKICEKCSYESSDEKEFKKKLGLYFCSVCFCFAPDDPEKLDEFIDEKIPKESISAFRKYSYFKEKPQKTGMIKKASEQGKAMSRAPFGYKFLNGNLVPAENSDEIEEIFQKFLNEKISLTKLAKQHNLSVNGLKKILTNFTYVGKIKFNGQLHNGIHKPIISSTLFNHVQNKLEKLGIKKIKSS